MTLFGSSGIRAPFSSDLLTLAFRVGLAAGRRHRNVVVATDTRTSGDAMKHSLCAGLAASGARIADAGIVPTPTLAYVTRDFDAGVMVTASHNPPEYNGLKLLNPDGSSFGTDQQAELEADLAAEPDIVGWEQVGQTVPFPDAAERHTARIREDFPDDTDVRVVVDGACGAGSLVTPGLLEGMGCDVITINCYHSGFFPRLAEPIAANLGELMDTVRETGAALGLAHDGDADRLMAVDETGRFDYEGLRWKLGGLSLALHGAHQRSNAALALAALEVSQRDFTVSEAAIRQGLREVFWPGRFEILGRSPTVVIDGAHNMQGVEVLVREIRALAGERKIRVLFGAMGDKDWQGMLQELAKVASDFVLTRAPMGRSVDPESLRQSLPAGVTGKAMDDPLRATAVLLEGAAADDIVLLTGSIYLLGEVRPALLCRMKRGDARIGGLEVPR